MLSRTTHLNSIPPRRRMLRAAVLFFSFVALAAVPRAARADVRVSATIDPDQAVVGDPIRYRLTVESSDSQTQPDALPSVSNWGGLAATGPRTSSQMATSVIGAALSVQNVITYEWRVNPPRQGSYQIGPAEITVAGKTYRTQPVTLQVAANQPKNLPTGLQNEPILSARTDDADVNRQLEGRLFLRATVSNKTPYIREPVIITYTLCKDRVPLTGFEPSLNDLQGALHDELYNARQIDFRTTDLGGKQFQVAQMYRMAVTPTKAGKLTLNGYTMKVRIPVSRPRGNDPFNDPFFSPFMDDPFGGGSIVAELPSPPVELDVRPLPTAGQPKDFSGTVGDFTLSATADRKQLTADDLVTVRLAIEGKGAIDLAYAPAFPANPDFQLAGQPVARPVGAGAADSRKTAAPEGIGGRKVFELVLRPTHIGDLHIPAIRYPTFNPASGRYVDLSTPAVPVRVDPGKVAQPPNTPAQLGTPAADGQTPAQTSQLRYLHTIGTLAPAHAEPLVEGWGFWTGQLIAAGLMLGGWKRHRRLATQDPARKRRDGAWRSFERRLRDLRQRQAAPPQEIAGYVEQAARTFIADRFNVAPDGLTRFDIERLLLDHAVPEVRVQRLCEILENCEALRYAPIGARDGELGRWMGEIESIFKENLRE